MVVGGAPEANATHARDVAKGWIISITVESFFLISNWFVQVALRFRKETDHFVVPNDNQLDGTTQGSNHSIRLGNSL